MRFERLTSANDDMFLRAMDLYWSAVPLKKQREYQSQCAIMDEADYRFELIYEGEEFAGILLCWEAEKFIYVEHFCVLGEKRGQGLGGIAMEMLKGEGKTLILECDPPANLSAERAEKFFRNRGFEENGYEHVHRSYHAMFPGNRLTLMSYPGELSDAEYKDFDDYLNYTVMAM